MVHGMRKLVSFNAYFFDVKTKQGSSPSLSLPSTFRHSFIDSTSVVPLFVALSSLVLEPRIEQGVQQGEHGATEEEPEIAPDLSDQAGIVTHEILREEGHLQEVEEIQVNLFTKSSTMFPLEHPQTVPSCPKVEYLFG